MPIMSYRLLLRNNLKLYKIMSHRYYCSDGFFVCLYAFLLYKEIVHIYFMIPLSLSLRLIVFSADLCLLPWLMRQEMLSDNRLPLSLE